MLPNPGLQPPQLKPHVILLNDHRQKRLFPTTIGGAIETRQFAHGSEPTSTLTLGGLR